MSNPRWLRNRFRDALISYSELESLLIAAFDATSKRAARRALSASLRGE
jgi:hypothetical protein